MGWMRITTKYCVLTCFDHGTHRFWPGSWRWLDYAHETCPFGVEGRSFQGLSFQWCFQGIPEFFLTQGCWLETSSFQEWSNTSWSYQVICSKIGMLRHKMIFGDYWAGSAGSLEHPKWTPVNALGECLVNGQAENCESFGILHLTR